MYQPVSEVAAMQSPSRSFLSVGANGDTPFPSQCLAPRQCPVFVCSAAARMPRNLRSVMGAALDAYLWTERRGEPVLVSQSMWSLSAGMRVCAKYCQFEGKIPQRAALPPFC